MSARSWSAVRASAAATPGPSSASSSGSTVRRTRTRVNRGSSLCGSSHQVDALGPAGRLGLGAGHVEQRPAEDASKARRIPASDRPPDPRARPSSTVSAWSSRVWPSSTTLAPSAGPRPRSSDGVPGLPGGRLGPDGRRRVDARPGPSTVSSAPRPAIWATTPRGALGRAVLQPVVDGRRRRPASRRSRASNTVRGEQGQRVGAAGAGDEHRLAAGVGGAGERAPYGEADRGDGGVRTGSPSGRGSPRRPGRRSRPWWAGSPASCPDGVEARPCRPCRRRARTKRGAVAVLRHLGVEAEQPAHAAGRGCRRPCGAW